MTKEARIEGLLGIAAKGRNLASGAFQTEKAVKDGSAFLVIVSTDAGENTKKDFSDMCKYYDVPIVFFSLKERLGKITGKEMRSCLAVTDEGLSKSIMKIYDEEV